MDFSYDKNMKPLIIYYTTTGFTKQYVDWISSEIDCDVLTVLDTKNEDLLERDTVVIASSIHGGNLRNFKKFKPLISDQSYLTFIVCGVGAAPANDEVPQTLKTNHHDKLPSNTQYFYCPGGLDYKKMSFLDKLMMKTFAKVMKRKAKKGNFDEVWAQKLSQSYNITDKNELEPILNILRNRV